MIRTRSRTFAAAAIAAALLFTAACSDDDGDDTASTDTETTAADAGDSTDPYGDTGSTEAADTTEGSDDAASGTTISSADSDLGTYLVDGNDLTLYVFSNDTQGEPSTCTGGCGAAWPTVAGGATAADEAAADLIGTVTNDDGTEQATYDGWPLYYYAEDAAPGDTNGQGVGGVWWVMAPDGTPIES